MFLAKVWISYYPTKRSELISYEEWLYTKIVHYLLLWPNYMQNVRFIILPALYLLFGYRFCFHADWTRVSGSVRISIEWKSASIPVWIFSILKVSNLLHMDRSTGTYAFHLQRVNANCLRFPNYTSLVLKRWQLLSGWCSIVWIRWNCFWMCFSLHSYL